jgi:hypothetical protein
MQFTAPQQRKCFNISHLLPQLARATPERSNIAWKAWITKELSALSEARCRLVLQEGLELGTGRYVLNHLPRTVVFSPVPNGWFRLKAYSESVFTCDYFPTMRYDTALIPGREGGIRENKSNFRLFW